MKCPFKVGENILCIKTYEEDPSFLTIGKTYTVVTLARSFSNDSVVGDNGGHVIPNWNFFVSAKEARKLKLKKLNEIKTYK
jgi:hypothetical protein